MPASVSRLVEANWVSPDIWDYADQTWRTRRSIFRDASL